MNYMGPTLRVLFFVLAFAAKADAQYTITGMEEYIAPRYLVITDATSDYLGARARFFTEMERNGFQVISEQQRATLEREENVAVRVAEVLASYGSAGASERELRKQLSSIGVNWSIQGKGAVSRFVAQGLAKTWTVKTPRGKHLASKSAQFAWVEGTEVPALTLTSPNTFHFLSFNYVYRESLSCGSTFARIHGSVNDASNGANRALVSFEFAQPMLGTACPNEVVFEIAKRLRPEVTAQPTEPEIALEVKAGADGLDAISTLMIVAQPGTDCSNVASSDAVDLFALELIQHFDIVDRSVQALIFEEQHLAMTGLMRDSDLVEAGMQAGAQGILTVQGSCLAGKAIWKAKLISVETSVLLLSAIGTDAQPQQVAARINAALN